jgi:hypothetical protein
MAMSFKDIGWTDDFHEFKAKIEPFFGPIEEIAAKHPALYAHQVLSHGFMEYAGIRGLSFGTRFEHELKQEFLDWMKTNNLDMSMAEEGWQEFLND